MFPGNKAAVSWVQSLSYFLPLKFAAIPIPGVPCGQFLAGFGWYPTIVTDAGFHLLGWDICQGNNN